LFTAFQGFAEEQAAKAEIEKEASDFIKKDDYLELNSSIEQMNARIRAKKDTLKKLLLDKDSIKDPVEFKNTVKQIEDEYREINELSENIDKKRAIIRYRFPERSFVKSSEKEKVQRLEEIGSEAIIEKEMNQLFILVENQYGRTVRSKADDERNKRNPASDSKNQDSIEIQQNPNDFTKSLILKK
jgi:hypothetical protein